MKIVLTFVSLIIFSVSAFAQKSGDVLATAGGQAFTVKDLPVDAQKLWSRMPTIIANERSQRFSEMIAQNLLETEAKTQNTTVEKLLADVKAKVPAPKDEEIKTVYDANRAQLGNLTLEEARPQIVAFLRGEPEQQAVQTYIRSLETKYKVSFGKDINAPDLKPLESLANIGGATISVQEFEEKNKNALYEARADIFDQIKSNLEETIYISLLNTEAKAQGIDASDLIAREVTNKMHDYSDEERFSLQNAYKQQLFTKYNVKFSLGEPAPVVQTIITAGSPSRGNPAAPVTVVMFSDFQCSHCAATHPILQKVLADYKDKIRFVIRDYPLTKIHENAFQAAVAANAVNKQGKFFEYIEILYANQNNLDKESLKKYAASLGLNMKQFELDLNDEKTVAAVRKDLADGDNYGITGTPTIFINGIKVRDYSAEGFRNAIEKALKK